MTNPGLGPLAANGGPTETIAVLPGSPAINAGSNALAVDPDNNPLVYDRRGVGFPRIVDRDRVGDIGAFESLPGQSITFAPIPNQSYPAAPSRSKAPSTLPGCPSLSP